jgi:thymidine phosphorylase
LPTEAFITAMDAPLGRAVGNAVEVIECIEGLKGRGPDDLMQLVVSLASRILVLSGRYDDRNAEIAVRAAVSSGAALDKLREVIRWQGGEPRVIDHYDLLPAAARRLPVTADQDGYVSVLQADLIGRASMALGAGRERVEDQIDRGAGVLIARKPGERVRAGETIVELLYNDTRGLEKATALVRDAIRLSTQPPVLPPLVHGIVR